MNDDWRVRLEVANRTHAAELAATLGRGELEHQLESGAGERVIVSADEGELFLYTSTGEQAERAERAISALAQSKGWSLRTELARWHPVAEEWAPPEVPLPESPDGIATEHAELVARERAQSSGEGFSQYEVKVELRSHQDTSALADQLRGEGLTCVRRWRYLLIGAADEDSARALADRLTAEAPAGSSIVVEASLAAIAADTPANPFAVFGGLGG
jgi:hypothetical protein